MDGRQRVLQAVNFREADRVPIDFWAAPEVLDRLARDMGVADAQGVLKKFGADLQYYRGPGMTPAAPDAQGAFADHWGVKRRMQTVTGKRKDGQPYTWTYKHLAACPLAGAASVADVEKHTWPDGGKWDYSGVKAACQAIRQEGLAVVFGGDRLDRTAQLKAGMYLRGTEQFVMDLAVEPEIAECILEHVAAYYMDYNRRVFEAADGNIDIFFMGDDMGTQNSTWVSRDMYRTFFKKRFAGFNELAHRFGIKTMYHTCGRVSDLVAEFVDAGLDILQSLQPGPMARDFAAIKREFGRQLCFQGGIDIQGVLPSGTPDDVRRHVRETAEILAPGGGYIFGTAHNLIPDVPTENILALVQAYHEFGRYSK
jgi:uroporphyrinogen decarboxylase